MDLKTQEPAPEQGAGLSKDGPNQTNPADNSPTSGDTQARSPAVKACIDRNARRLAGADGADLGSLGAKEARLELMFENISDNTGACDARDVAGMLYSLRQARAYWKALSTLAADELIPVEAERLSILRQAEDADA